MNTKANEADALAENPVHQAWLRDHDMTAIMKGIQEARGRKAERIAAKKARKPTQPCN